jgi:hypothetical protein
MRQIRGIEMKVRKLKSYIVMSVAGSLYCCIFAQVMICEASKDPLLHNNQQTCDDVIKQ